MPEGKERLLAELRSQIAQIELSAKVESEQRELSTQAERFPRDARVSEKLADGLSACMGFSASDCSTLQPSTEDSSDLVFRKLSDLASRREYSREGMKRRLKRYEFGEQAIEDALSRAIRCGFIDDARYAEVLVRSRMSQGRGLRGIERELLQDGIDPMSVPLFAEMRCDERRHCDSELDRALQVLDRKPPRSKNVRASAYRRLISRGFDAPVASHASKVWVERHMSSIY